MKRWAYLLATLFAMPAWTQEPASFYLKSQSVQKIVQEAASRQSADVQLVEKPAAKTGPAGIKYVPPEKAEVPVRVASRQPPPRNSPANTFAAAMIDILVDDLLNIEGNDVDAANDMLRCRVEKDIKNSPPGPDNCPSVY